jgi:hypothetical protein
MNKITVIAIVVSTFIGTIAGYWYRGQVLLTQQQTTAAAIMGAAPQVLKLQPGTPPPLP